MKIRSIKQQFKYCINSNLGIGESKRAGYDESKLYSIERIENMRDFCNQFSNFLKENYPNIRLVKDITPQHCQEFLNRNSEKWTNRTAQEQISKFKKLDKMLQNTYHTKPISKDLIEPQCKKESTRKIAFDRADYERLIKSFDDRNSFSHSRIGAEITARVGLRVKEVSRLTAERINLEKQVIEVREGGKNGKFRDVPIREKDIPFFRELKEKTVMGRICPITEDGINKGIRDELKRLNLDEKYKNTTEHAIRKMYATERMTELRGQAKDGVDPRTDEAERKAWAIVQQELGHGSALRMALYNAYIK